MPTEYYVGAAIGVIVIVLLGLLLKPRRQTRRVVQQNRIETDQLMAQLSRIADSLDVIVARLGALPAVANAPVAQAPAEKSSVQVRPPDRHVERPVEQAVERPVEPPVAEKPKTPSEEPVPPSEAAQEKPEPPPERHVKLSMFGR